MDSLGITFLIPRGATGFPLAPTRPHEAHGDPMVPLGATLDPMGRHTASRIQWDPPGESHCDPVGTTCGNHWAHHGALGGSADGPGWDTKGGWAWCPKVIVGWGLLHLHWGVCYEPKALSAPGHITQVSYKDTLLLLGTYVS